MGITTSPQQDGYRRLLLISLITMLLLIGTVGAALAQQSAPPAASPQVYRMVEQMPRFPGGDAALMEELARNLHYPAEAKAQGIEGKVFVQFVVDQQGRTRDAVVVKGLGKAFDENARRAVLALPAFTPGRQNGQAVAVLYTLPIAYEL